MKNTTSATRQNTTTVQIITPSEGCFGFEDADKELLRKIKAIIARGNDAEIRRKKDGRLTVYEIKKNIV